MRKHVIYYFSGTGNSLKAALTFQKALGNCDVISMGTPPDKPGKVDSIGFVFPCYFGGVPQRVLEYIARMDFTGHRDTYIYAVVTYGAMLGTTLAQLQKALRSRGVNLAYAAPLKAFANYVVMYDMSDKVSEKLAQTKADMQPIIADIVEQKKREVKKPSPLIGAYNRIAGRDVHALGSKFVVRASCDSCGVCSQVCPVRNIKLEEGIPQWQGRCEQCMACVQWCPRRAIDYGEKTRRRGRYTNPEITFKMFIEHMHNNDNNEEG